MKAQVTISHLQVAYDTACKKLKQYFESIVRQKEMNLKLPTNYFNWLSKKTMLIQQENEFKIPCCALPNTFTQAQREWLLEDKQKIFDKYYKFDALTKKYIINTKKADIPYDDIDILMHSMVLTRKAVVWVEFGVNVGVEFGGRHPAIILKNLDDSLIVIPLSSQRPDSDKYAVKVDTVFGFSTLTRWANVARIREVDISRVDFNCRIGNVNAKVMSDISNKIHACGIL